MVDNLLSHHLLPTSIFYFICNKIKNYFFFVFLNVTETLREEQQQQQLLEFYASIYIKKAKIDRSLPLASTCRIVVQRLFSFSLCINSLPKRTCIHTYTNIHAYIQDLEQTQTTLNNDQQWHHHDLS